MRSFRLAVPLLLVVLASACTTVHVGRDFDMTAFNAKVQRGASTKADVRGWLGEPSGIGASVESSGERYEEWSYFFGTVRIPGAEDSHVKVLQIKFDRGGVVRAYNWSGERS